MTVRILKGDCREVLRTLEDESVHCVVTSPPYWGMRDYGVAGQIGLEPTPGAFVAELVDVFRDVRRVLRSDGTLWLNLGDSYASAWPCNRRNVVGSGSLPNGKREARPPRLGGDLKEKDLIGVPWTAALALRADAWYLRQDIIWSKPNPMPESVRDRCTKAHEYIFMFSKSARYHYDADAIAEDGALGLTGEEHNRHSLGTAIPEKERRAPRKTDKQRGHRRRHAGFNDRWDAMERAEQCSGKRNKRSVWNVATQGYSEAHFATFPPALIEPCVLAGCPAGGTVLDPFGGAGTTGMVADRLGRNAILIELNPDYADMAERRITNDAGMFASVEKSATAPDCPTPHK